MRHHHLDKFVPTFDNLEANFHLDKDLHTVAKQLQKNNIQNSIVFFGSARILSQEEANEKLKNILAEEKKDTKEYDKKLQTVQTALAMSRFYTEAEDLAYRLTKWVLEHAMFKNYFTLCSGGGPSIMEACNKGANRAQGSSIGLSINIAREQKPNIYITPDLHFKFDTFMLRKFWFFHHIKALIVFPGGFGTMDELFEALTLIATKKIKQPVPCLLYGIDYWKEILNIDALIKYGTIHEEEAKLITYVDDVESAFLYITQQLEALYLR